MTIGAALTALAVSVDAGEAAVAGASAAMAKAAGKNDAGAMAAAIPGLTSGMAVMKMGMTQQSVLSSAMVEGASTLGGAGR